MFLENEHQPIISHSSYDLARPLEHHHHHHLNHHAASNHLQSGTDHLQEDSEGRSTASSPTSSYRDLSGCEDFDLKIPKPSGPGSGTGGHNNNNNHNNNNKEQKPKKHKCKHCGLECTEKVQYWKHIRTHIKPEQLLECPNCEFATDLKHHYEYHLLNHTGAKPFTCPDCDYKCVSKSMLQSHLKSHSNVFQFQCYDCGYASKYMHSLKQHLKKRDHRPATPLNPDGTPNPDIVIDVVGNRRGPRQNKKQNRHNPYQQQHQQQQPKQSMTVCSSQDDGGSSSGGHPSPYSMQQLLQMPSSGCAQVTYPTSAESFMYSMITKRSMEMVDYQAAEYLAIKNNNNNNNNSSSVDDKMDVQQYHNQQQHNNHYHKRGHQYHSDDVLKVELAGRSGSGGDRTPEPQVPVLAVADPSPPPVVLAIESGPLNLSRDSVAPRAAGSSRRKGIACKLERPATEPQSKSVPVVVVPDSPAVPMDCSSESRGGTAEDTSIPVKVEFQPYHHHHYHQQQTSSSSSTPEKEDKEDETHVCHHCDIIFKENIMYSMHMGFHSFRDPFACNLCGEITADKFSFFAHIARVPHS
ncbi:PREDICTED: protein hunchback [Diuraphis noxia]|uniref:protein hunchback n=1 Tax=Diuraphis noxia TaxID=143948 RepID=UPI0007638FD8|nr:PREDICTED: protein hunchback [Diuraphis noxia]